MCSLLLTRGVMFAGWYHLITGRQQRRDSDEFLMVSPKRMSLGTALQSDNVRDSGLHSPTKASFSDAPPVPLLPTTSGGAYRLDSGAGDLRRRSNDAELGRAASQGI